ncbi:E3 ubiquitin-protein ligase RNF13 [Cylas formicarius]|uniref:E3 ubiquitin-protein ligase RNF13 n=1 Tax=Cylas formicarius TaxID=197179 RepID=UPI0029584365|nr:E3 ubiquitin-protein ligase RNF13 [Cylas formicarius]
MISHLLVFLAGQAINMVTSEIFAVRFDSQYFFEEFPDAPANFGPSLFEDAVKGVLVDANRSGCFNDIEPPDVNPLDKSIVLLPRYSAQNCSFETKVRNAQSAGYDAVIVYNIGSNELIPMSATNKSGIAIPSVFVGEQSGLMLKNIYTGPEYFIVITGGTPFNIETHLLIPFAIVVGICFVVIMGFMIAKFIKDRRRQRRHRLPKSSLKKIPTCKFQKGDPYETCAICLDDFVEGEKLRVLPCNHVYHTKCIDPWLTKNRRVCPICKRKVFAHDELHHNEADSDSEADDTTPLINASNRGTQGGTFEELRENLIQRAIRSISQQSGTANLVTASDHHSINGEYVSTTSSTTGTSELESSGPYHFCDEFEVHVHQPQLQNVCDDCEVHVHQPQLENVFDDAEVHVHQPDTSSEPSYNNDISI